MKQNKYFVESSHPEVLQKLLKDPVIQQCRLRRSDDDNALEESSIKKTSGAAALNSAFSAAGTDPSKQANPTESDTGENGNNVAVPTDITDYYSKIDAEEDDEEEQKVVSFEVDQAKIEVIQKRCIQLEYPLLAEYDFRNDTRNPDIK